MTPVERLLVGLRAVERELRFSSRDATIGLTMKAALMTWADRLAALMSDQPMIEPALTDTCGRCGAAWANHFTVACPDGEGVWEAHAPDCIFHRVKHQWNGEGAGPCSYRRGGAPAAALPDRWRAEARASAQSATAASSQVDEGEDLADAVAKRECADELDAALALMVAKVELFLDDLGSMSDESIAAADPALFASYRDSAKALRDQLSGGVPDKAPCVQCGTTTSRDGDWYRICGPCRWQDQERPGG